MKPGAVIGAYTGILSGPMDEMHDYIEVIMGRPVYTHEMGDKEIMQEVKEKAKTDFLKVVKWLADKNIQEG